MSYTVMILRTYYEYHSAQITDDRTVENWADGTPRLLQRRVALASLHFRHAPGTRPSELWRGESYDTGTVRARESLLPPLECHRDLFALRPFEKLTAILLTIRYSDLLKQKEKKEECVLY
jgi:hypothetical protein